MQKYTMKIFETLTILPRMVLRMRVVFLRFSEKLKRASAACEDEGAGFILGNRDAMRGFAPFLRGAPTSE